jgi:hypothetical protein
LLEPKSDLGFPEFLFKYNFESGQVSMRRVVPHLNIYPSIFDLEFLELGRSLL